MPTVIGTAQDVTRNFFAGILTFENLSVPIADGSRVTCSAIFSALPDPVTGAFSIDLAPGVYKLTASDRTRKFTVPAGTGNYNLADLLQAAAETPLPWLKQADTLSDLRSIKTSKNLRLAYVVADGNGFEAFYKHTSIPPVDDGNGSILSDDGLGGWTRTSIT